MMALRLRSIEARSVNLDAGIVEIVDPKQCNGESAQGQGLTIRATTLYVWLRTKSRRTRHVPQLWLSARSGNQLKRALNFRPSRSSRLHEPCGGFPNLVAGSGRGIQQVIEASLEQSDDGH